jgi:glycosyltransferase involved in cell wall biosynthesis
MNQPTVSVIIPVWNGAYYLQDALASVFAQTYLVHEVIVIDDGADDAMVEVAREYSGVTVLTQAHAGVSAARNLGLSVATGDIIAYLDADDIWLPDKLESQINVLLSKPELGYVLCRMRVFCEAGCSLPDTLNQQHYAADPIAAIPSALVVWRSVVDAVGLFDQNLETAEDADWFGRAGSLGILADSVDQILLEKRLHGTNISLTCPTNTSNLLKVLHRSILRKKATSEPKEGSDD